MTDEIIRRSDERLKDLLNPFDPISGEGSFLPRFAAKITNEGKPIWLPQSMHEEFGRLETEALSDIVAIDSREFQREIERMSAWRTVHDFEFWCYTTAIIMDKESEKKIPFRLNRAQRKVLIKLEAMRLAGDPIRLILLKARQWGGSTMVQIYIAWIQLIHKENWHSTIIAAQETQAVNIRSMYNTLLKNYPLGDHKLEPFEGSSKNRIIKNRGCIQSIGSYEKPDSIRSYDIRCSHLCLHPDTPIITENGFIKPVKDIVVGDKVLTDIGNETVVTAVTGSKPVARNGNGRAISIRPWLSGFPIITTPNHPIRTTRGWIPAGELQPEDELMMPIRKIIPQINEIQLSTVKSRPQGGGKIPHGSGAVIQLDRDFGFTVGYYLAEGSVHMKGSKVKELTFSRHDKDKEYSDKAIYGIKKFIPQVTHSDVSAKDCLTTHCHVYDSCVAKYFIETFGKKEDKVIPDWFFNTSREFLEGVFCGYISGDGSKNNGKQDHYELAEVNSTTISSSIAMQMRDIAASLGYGWAALSVREAGNHYGRNCKKAWIIRWNGDSARRIRKLLGWTVPDNGKLCSEKTRADENFVYIKIRKLEETKIDYVYDVEVAHSDHSFRTVLFAVKNSEIGTWQATAGRKPEDLIGSVAGAMLPMANTIAVYESTAQGQGNYFHEKWLKAESGRDDAFQHCFVPWFDNPFDIIHFKTDTDKRRFAEHLNDAQIKMLELGATLEGLKWYRFRQSEIESKGGTDVMMLQENPSTPEEAFQSSGYRVFPVNYVSKIRRTCRPPAFIGDIHADEMKGKGAFKNIKFDESQNGHMKVWSMPNDPPVDEGFIFSGDRYVITLDISGGTSDKADFSSIGVIDRYWMAVDEENGKPEVVADWHGRMDADLVAWKAVQIAYWYNKGLFVPESNTFESRYQKTEGDHSFTVLDEIKYEYENIYMRQSPDRLNEQMIDRPGFNSNVSTKPMIVDNFKAFMREDAYVERNLELIHESDLYEVKPNGSYGALDGKHDDILMQRMIGLWIAIKKLPWPKLVKLSEIGNQQKKTSASAAQF